ncbi:hypothetical protein C8P68_104273 [Mucilaginibacter yixingensis]|uniref:Universal stress protein family protein n=1 Tax=Mucilaginibacter yixingensis TaxID=1295612 RepID=A0A2T5J9S8_9SPHI|nr:hypothetical protein [Mucilaginibacter yixingensis]PTQ96784.1 hypothetical protein C8P68_104273 [Mucilaginibacter yixingensis]
MKTLLIPTDFQLETTHCVPQLVHRFHPQKLNILMVHLVGITDSVGELLMLSRRSAENRFISDDFYRTCHNLRKSYADSIQDIRIEFFYGNTMAAFKNYLDANNVDTIVTLKDLDYELLTERSLDPDAFINRSGRNVLTIDLNKPLFELPKQAPLTVLEPETV